MTKTHNFNLVYGEEVALIIFTERIEENNEAICSYFDIISRDGSISIDDDILKNILIVLAGRSTELDGSETREVNGKDLIINFALDI